MTTTVTYATRQIGSILVGEFVLQSPSGINPMSSTVVRDMRARLAELDNIDPPHALLIAARGKCFSAGADLKEFRDITAEGFRAYMAQVLALYEDMVNVKKPIVSLVQGDARGGGAALAFFSDFVIAAETAKFALPEAHRGLAGGGYLMPRLLGKHRAAEMVLLGRVYSAQRMLELGLINEVCAVDRLEERLAVLCDELGTLTPGAFAVAKRGLAAGLSIGLREAMAEHVAAQTDAFMLARQRGLL